MLGSALALLTVSAGGASAQAKLPVLQRMILPALDTLGPEKASATIAISSSGAVAYTGSFDSRNRAVAIVDSTGRLVARLGPPGQGPGELGVALQLAFSNAEVIVVDVGTRRVSRFGFDGAFHGSATMPAPMILVGATGDSLDMVQWPSGVASSPVLDFVRVSPVSMSGRLLFSGQNPVLRELSEEGRQEGNTLASITYIADDAVVVAANVGSYHLLGVDGEARVIFDVRGARVRTSPGEMPLFVNGALQRDGMRRIWALGTDHETGRTFADIYLRGRSLGRLYLPCKGAVSISGSFMAILCAEPQAADRDVSLRVYRIIEQR